MEKIGIVKGLDGLCRIVIPKDIRARYGITDEIEIVCRTGMTRTSFGTVKKPVFYVKIF